MSLALTPTGSAGFLVCERPQPGIAQTPIWLLVEPANTFAIGHSLTVNGQSYTVVERLPFLHNLPCDHIALRLSTGASLS